MEESGLARCVQTQCSLGMHGFESQSVRFFSCLRKTHPEQRKYIYVYSAHLSHFPIPHLPAVRYEPPEEALNFMDSTLGPLPNLEILHLGETSLEYDICIARMLSRTPNL